MATFEDDLSTATTQGRSVHELGLPEGLIQGENCRAALESSGSNVLNLFFGAVPDVTRDKLHDMLSAAWTEDPNMVLRVIFNLGNCRKGEGGKSDKKNFERALLWLLRHHPETFLANIGRVPEHGSLQSLLNLLKYAIHEDKDSTVKYSLEHCIQTSEAHKAIRKKIQSGMSKKLRRREKCQRQVALKQEFAATIGSSVEQLMEPRRKKSGSTVSQIKSLNLNEPDSTGRRTVHVWKSNEVKAQFAQFIAVREAGLAAAAKHASQDVHEAVAALVQSLPEDGVVSRARAAIAEIFSSGLVQELEYMASGKPLGGLFAKWAPSPGKAHDRATLIVDEIISRLPQSVLNSKGKTPRTRYQQMLSKLRRAAEIPETFVGKGEWSSVNYVRMPSRCRAMYGQGMFRKHDALRYDAFLEAAREAICNKKEGKQPKVNVAGVLPHEVIAMAEKQDASADLMWYEMVNRVRGCSAWGGEYIPVCDVSGSMTGIPMEVAIALSMLMAESAPESSVWRGKMFTFSSQPKLVTVPDIPTYMEGDMGNLAKRVEFVRGMEWGMNTNIDAVFDQILDMAQRHAMSQDALTAMCIVIFSDMEFDEASEGGVPWETAHEGIQRRFRDVGYATLPTLVYWNLRSSSSIPASAGEEGVVLISGFSTAMMEAFLSRGVGALTPATLMRDLLSKPCYEALRVLD